MKPIALLSSVPFESDAILASVKNIRTFIIAGKAAYRGKLEGRDVLLMNTGISKVNAAHTATGVMENLSVQAVINFGVGGAYPRSGLKVGDIAVATKEINGDEGVAGLKQWKGMNEIGIPLVKEGRKRFFNEFPVDKSLLKKVMSPLQQSLAQVAGFGSGTFITVSAASGSTRRAAGLEKLFSAVCENMEGAAIAHVCVIYNVPFFEVRGISNAAGVRDKKKWDVPLAAANCQQAVLEIVRLAGY